MWSLESGCPWCARKGTPTQWYHSQTRIHTTQHRSRLAASVLVCGKPHVGTRQPTSLPEVGRRRTTPLPVVARRLSHAIKKMSGISEQFGIRPRCNNPVFAPPCSLLIPGIEAGISQQGMHCSTTRVRAISDKVLLRGGIDIRSDIFFIHYLDLLKIPSVLSIDTWGEKTVPLGGGGESA